MRTRIASTPSGTLLATVFLVVSVTLSGCITKAMWAAALERKGEVIRSQQCKVESLWAAGAGQLGVETATRGRLQRVLLQPLDSEALHVVSVLESCEPRCFTVVLRLLEEPGVADEGEIELSGFIPNAVRRLDAEPARPTTLPDSLRRFRLSLRVLAADEPPVHNPALGGWLFDGAPTTDVARIEHAFGFEQETADLAFLRRLELWQEADRDGTDTTWYAARGDALWMDRHGQCIAKPDGVLWRHRSRWSVGVRAPEPGEDAKLMVPDQSRLDVSWHTKRSRFWYIVGATLATPVTFVADCAVTAAVGFAVLALLSHDDDQDKTNR